MKILAIPSTKKYFVYVTCTNLQILNATYKETRILHFYQITYKYSYYLI